MDDDEKTRRTEAPKPAVDANLPDAAPRATSGGQPSQQPTTPTGRGRGRGVSFALPHRQRRHHGAPIQDFSVFDPETMDTPRRSAPLTGNRSEESPRGSSPTRTSELTSPPGLDRPVGTGERGRSPTPRVARGSRGHIRSRGRRGYAVPPRRRLSSEPQPDYHTQVSSDASDVVSPGSHMRRIRAQSEQAAGEQGGSEETGVASLTNPSNVKETNPEQANTEGTNPEELNPEESEQVGDLNPRPTKILKRSHQCECRHCGVTFDPDNNVPCNENRRHRGTMHYSWERSLTQWTHEGDWMCYENWTCCGKELAGRTMQGCVFGVHEAK
ncbi:hypothetical protein F5Y04DRAFT_25384 [Hypomontagnella monticulosa]|nr:hypothetical protein F5Y04DRAFT_25384 [Hypomontagnella monticulosa]